MKMKLLPIAMLLSSLLMLASCLGDNDNEYVFDDNTAITAFQVNTVNQYLHTKAKDGSDSVYSKTLTCTTYKFYVDHLKGEIYNPDSLPVGADAKKVMCTVTCAGSGTLAIKSMTSDSIALFNSSDSTDFSQPRVFYVYSQSGQHTRKYTIKVNVHRQQPDSMQWHALPATDVLRSMTAAKAVECGGRIYVFGTDGKTTFAVSTADGTSWRNAKFNFNHTLAADAYNSIVAKGGHLYICDAGTVLRSTDGDTWEQRAQDTGITRLVAASPYRLYAYAADGTLMASADDGTTWAAAAIDAETSLLPTTDVASFCLPMKGTSTATRVMLIGKAGQGMAVWGKVDQTPGSSEDQPWSYYEASSDNTHLLPALSGMAAFAYDGAAYAFGTLDGKLKSYRSEDGGITWRSDTTVAQPADETLATGRYALAVDAESHIWIVSLGSATVWKGRLNRLGWATEPTSYTKNDK